VLGWPFRFFSSLLSGESSFALRVKRLFTLRLRWGSKLGETSSNGLGGVWAWLDKRTKKMIKRV
jgi:hypothetical protein